MPYSLDSSPSHIFPHFACAPPSPQSSLFAPSAYPALSAGDSQSNLRRLVTKSEETRNRILVIKTLRKSGRPNPSVNLIPVCRVRPSAAGAPRGRMRPHPVRHGARQCWNVALCRKGSERPRSPFESIAFAGSLQFAPDLHAAVLARIPAPHRVNSQVAGFRRT